MTQEQALTILKTGASVFLTGEPGSGKTHTINEYVAYLRAREVPLAVTASTGIAATHIGGMTIHSWSGVGIKTNLDKHDLHKIAASDYIGKRVRRTKVLIIDEVSMLSPGTLSMIDAVLREIKKNLRPFGGLQVVLVGDFFQLPPITKNRGDKTENNTEGNISQGTLLEEVPALFAYDAPAWTRTNLIVCYLTEQHRQDDPSFLDILSSIRRNAFSEDHLTHLAKRKVDRLTAPKDAPKLFSHNIEVDRVNDETLSKLPGDTRAFVYTSQGPEPLVAALKRGCLSPDELRLKINAAVMFTKNNQKEGFVNGTLGTVTGFSKFSGEPIVSLRSGRQIKVLPMDWTVEEGGKLRARFTQLPLRLAWAITVHKSQGMSLDEAVVDLSEVFEFGQGYVALSRVRRLSGLYLLGWNKRAFQVSPMVLEKDAAFREASSTAEKLFLKISLVELQQSQENFITVCGGKNKNIERRLASHEPVENTVAKSGMSFEKDGFNKIRAIYPNAYEPWDEAQDEKLKDFFAENLTVARLAKEFNRTRGSIRARLIKLGLVVK